MIIYIIIFFFFFSSRRRHTRCSRDWSSDVCSSDLFYFGNFNPSFNHQYVATVPGSGIAANYGSTQGVVDRITNSKDYAGKLTFKLRNSHTFESSVFGDPAYTNHVPWATLNAQNWTVNSQWSYGTRNWSARYDGALTSTWTVDGAFTWSWNKFSETPSADVVQIVDNRSEEHTSELQSRLHLVCRLL